MPTPDYTQDIEDVKEYYANLLILQYRGKIKARETVKEGINIYMGDTVLFQLQDILDIDIAEGAQLDIIGKILDCPRIVDWVNLSDDDYRILLKFKAIINVLRGSEAEMDEIYWNVFGGQVILKNNHDLSITYVVSSEIENIVRIALDRGYLRAPIGVGLNYIIEVPEPTKIFGFTVNNLPGNAITFSDKNNLRDGIFLTKDNLILARQN